MRIQSIALENFRNIAGASLELCATRVFFVGANGQGKTNLLEAVGLMGALRSFRTRDSAALVRKGEKLARVLMGLDSDKEGAAQLEVQLGGKAPRAILNGAGVTRMADFLGRFPVVPAVSEDMRLMRGSPGERRRPFDLLFSSGSPAYFEALRRYHKALKSRNELLRQQSQNIALFEAFEDELARAGAAVMNFRREGTAQLNADLCAIYAQLCRETETPQLDYAANVVDATESSLRMLFEKNRPRDRLAQSTHNGPQRDDFRFLLNGMNAKDYASEGQQRGLVLSWRLAQARWLERLCGQMPVLIADDILGELDPERRRGFWRAVPDTMQVIASGTTLPASDEKIPWRVYQVQEGMFFE